MSDEGLSRAVLVYLTRNYSGRDSGRAALESAFGNERAAEMAIRIEVMEERCLVLGQPYRNLESVAALDGVRVEFKREYPELSGEAIEVLVRRWSFNIR